MRNKLYSNFLFNGLSDIEIEDIFSYVKYSQVSYSKGQVLFQEGDSCENIGLIEENEDLDNYIQNLFKWQRDNFK